MRHGEPHARILSAQRARAVRGLLLDAQSCYRIAIAKRAAKLGRPENFRDSLSQAARFFLHAARTDQSAPNNYASGNPYSRDQDPEESIACCGAWELRLRPGTRLFRLNF